MVTSMRIRDESSQIPKLRSRRSSMPARGIRGSKNAGDFSAACYRETAQLQRQRSGFSRSIVTRVGPERASVARRNAGNDIVDLQE